MIEIKKTSQYDVKPNEMIADSFEATYGKYANMQIAPPPDTATFVCSLISMALIIGMLVLTLAKIPDQSTLWYILIAAIAVLTAYLIYRYLKKRSKYLKAAGKPSTINAKRDEFNSLFTGSKDAVLPETMSAGEFQNIVRPLLGKQTDAIMGNAIRSISEKLVAINNPPYPLVRLVTPVAPFTESKARLYVKNEGNALKFIDLEWSNPKGEISVPMSNIVGYGAPSKFASEMPSSYKARQESVILKAQDESTTILFEIAGSEFEKAKKVLPHKEIK